MLKSEKVYSLVPNRRELGLAECPGWKNIEKLISGGGGGRLIGTKEYKCFAQDFRLLIFCELNLSSSYLNFPLFQSHANTLFYKKKFL